MNKIRVIPVILLKNGRIVQSKNFNRHQVLGTPSVIVGRLSNWFADELIFLDISRKKVYDLNRNDLIISVGGGITGLVAAKNLAKSALKKFGLLSINIYMVGTPSNIVALWRDISSKTLIGSKVLCNTSFVPNIIIPVMITLA